MSKGGGGRDSFAHVCVPSSHLHLIFVFSQVLREVYAMKATTIVIDCTKEILAEVLKQAQQVGLVSEEYFYLVTSMDFHTAEMENLRVRRGGGREGGRRRQGVYLCAHSINIVLLNGTFISWHFVSCKNQSVSYNIY